MRFYAVYRPYGPDVLNVDGQQANTLHAFASRGARARYLRAQPRARALPASSPTVRRLLRRPAQEWWGDSDSASIVFRDRA